MLAFVAEVLALGIVAVAAGILGASVAAVAWGVIVAALAFIVRLVQLWRHGAPPAPSDTPVDPEQKVRDRFRRRRSDQMRESVRKAKERNSAHYW